MRRFILALLAFIGPLAGGLHAQRLSGNPFPTIEEPVPATDPSIHAFPHHEVHPALLAAGGILGGAVGVFGGALAGAKITQNDCEDCALVGAAYGAVAGGSALLPLGVHLANGRRGKLGPSLLSSLAIGAAGLGVAAASNSVDVMIAVPVLQIISSVLIERATGRRRQEGGN
ncbi:MAG: hypothetical protein ACREL3_01840 [Gemmatimonadales bacterium]